MKTMLSISLCIITLMSFSMWAPDASAYQFYSDDSGAVGDGTQNCAACHTAFRSNPNYVSPKDGSNWGDSLHNVHLNNTDISLTSCDVCHGGVNTSGRGVNLSSSLVGPGGAMAISCMGCHGRQTDTVANPNALGAGWGAGLRQHHFNSGVGICLGCHADADPGIFSPAGEDTMPLYYLNVTSQITGTNLEPCNLSGEEQLAGSSIGLDNDGDLLYDAADPDCQAGCILNTDCNNGQWCDGVETCNTATGECEPGTPPDCDDGVGCTIDGCDEGNDSCVHTPDDGPCDNGQWCDGPETCDAVNDCLPGTPPDCDDGIGCTIDGCDEDNDSCVNTPDDGPCDNGQWCDGPETCDPVNDCQAGTPPSPDDGVDCTDDSCDEVNDTIVNTPNDGNCDNGQFCDGSETCDPVNDCQVGTDPCLAGEICDEVLDICIAPCDFDPRTQGYWHRQCLGLPESEGGLDPGRNGRGPKSPTEPNFADGLMSCTDFRLEDLGFFGEGTCAGMDADPPSDPCERAKRQLTALILNVCSDRLTETCELDLSNVSCSAMSVEGLIQETSQLIQSGECGKAADCAALVNEGEGLVFDGNEH